MRTRRTKNKNNEHEARQNWTYSRVFRIVFLSTTRPAQINSRAIHQMIFVQIVSITILGRVRSYQVALPRSTPGKPRFEPVLSTYSVAYIITPISANIWIYWTIGLS